MREARQEVRSAEERRRLAERSGLHTQGQQLWRPACREVQHPATDARDHLPPVSVIMALYNGERYVAEAIDSVLCQTHKRFELIIVNDGSTDRSQTIINQYAERDSRIRVLSQENADQPASLNRGLAAARNEWVAVLDADDICMPHRLETQLRTLQQARSVRVLGSYAVRIDHTGRVHGIRTPRPTSVPEFRRLVKQNALVTLVHPSAMMHRPTILRLGGYDPSFGAAADMELWSRVSDEHVVVSLPEPLLYYRVHEASMSMSRFFEQRLMLRWIQARQYARRQGSPQPTLEDYQRSEGVWSTLDRLNHGRKDWAQYLAARSRLARWRGRYLQASVLQGIKLVLNPPLSSIRRLGNSKH